jgi:hypothetical protein
MTLNNEQIAAVAIVATAGGIVIGRVVRGRAAIASAPASRAPSSSSAATSESNALRELAMGAAARLATLAIDRVEAKLRGPVGPIVADYGTDEQL